MMIPIIDTHQHMWDLKEFSLPWLVDIESLNKSHNMVDYVTASEGSGISKTIYMEVDVEPSQRSKEVDYVSDFCNRDDNPMVAAVVSGSPMEEGFIEIVKSYRNNPYVKGVRQVLHVPEMPRSSCLEGSFIDGIRCLGEAGKSFDVCMRPSELSDALAMVLKCPDTLFILDHCGNADPQIVSGLSEPDGNEPFAHSRQQWLDDMSALGQCENVVCKLSGIIARAPSGWNTDLLAPTVRHCISSFGYDRVIVGGDWPVCNMGATLGAWINSLREIIQDYKETEQRAILNENAVRIYQLS
jgi:L-fuconolactonase